MPAFTFLAKKYNFSVAQHTITIYPKNLKQKKLRLTYDAGQKQLGIKIVPIVYFSRTLLRQIGRSEFITRKHSLHKHLHNDQFDREQIHYHLHFSLIIDETRLAQILSVFIELKFIALYEKFNFLMQYKAAKEWEADNSELPVFTEVDDKFLTKLEATKIKSIKLWEQADIEPEIYQSAARAAETLYEGLLEEIMTFVDNKNSETYEIFNENCNDLIKQVSPVLQEHKGWTRLLETTETAIKGLGIGYLFGSTLNHYKSNGVHVFFGSQPECIEEIEENEEITAAMDNMSMNG